MAVALTGKYYKEIADQQYINNMKCTICSHEFDWDTLDSVMYDEVLA